MRVSDEDGEALVRGVTTALDMMVDGSLQAVMVVGVYASGRGFKLWGAGNQRVNNLIQADLLRALPLPDLPHLHQDDEEEDGA